MQGDVAYSDTIAPTGDFNVNASGYKNLNIGVAGETMDIGGAANLNFTVDSANSLTKLSSEFFMTQKDININARAADGVTDAQFESRGMYSYKGFNASFKNFKDITFYNIGTEGPINNTIPKHVAVDFQTNVADARVTGADITSDGGGNIKANFIGQKTLNVSRIAETNSAYNSRIDVNIKGSGIGATADFNAITAGKNGVFVQAENLSYLRIGNLVSAYGETVLDTGTHGYLNNLTLNDGVVGYNVTLNIQNVIAPLNNGNDVNVAALKNIVINGYAGDSVSKYLISFIAPVDGYRDPVDGVAKLTNVKGTITGNPTPDHILKTMTVKGGITNPDSLIAAGENSDLSVDASPFYNLTSIDFSEYNNISGVTSINTGDAIQSAKLLTIKGSMTKDDITVNSANLKLVDSGAGDDKVKFTITQTKDITVNLGAGNDEIKFDGATELTANKKFQISGGEGNDTFILGLAKTDADASKYVTITDASRGDKISLGSTGTARLQKISLNVDSRADLKTAINDALGSLSSTDADTIYAVYYGNDTYLVRDDNGNKTLDNNDNLVKLSGLSNFDLLSANSVTQGGVNYIEITNA